MIVSCTFCVHICKSMCVCICAKGNETTQGKEKEEVQEKVFFLYPLFGLCCVIIFCTVWSNHSNNLFCYDMFQCAEMFRFMLLILICTIRMCTPIYADVAFLYMLTLLMWLYYAFSYPIYIVRVLDVLIPVFRFYHSSISKLFRFLLWLLLIL